MECLGALLGANDDASHAWFETQLRSHQSLFDMLLRDDLSVQITMLLLRLCGIPRMGYITRVMPPRLTATHAATFDAMILDLAIRKLELPTPLADEAQEQIRLPISLGGWGLRSVGAFSHVAYLCSVAQAAYDIVELLPLAKRREILLPSATQAPFAQQLTDSLNEVLTSEIACGDNGVVPVDTEQFWIRFGTNGLAKGLQRTITAHLETRAHNALLQHHDPQEVEGLKNIQRLKACSAPKANKWKSCRPFSPESTLSDIDYRNATRTCLGIPCQSDLPQRCRCEEEISNPDSDRLHFFSCHLLKRPAMTVRHDWLVQLLAEKFRRYGAIVHIEPRIFDFNRQRADLDIIFPNRRFFVDVTVVHPTSPSYTSRVQLAAATAAEARKSSHYARTANMNGTLYAFAVETFGGLGKQAVEVLKILQSAAERSNVLLIPGELATLVSVCLQKGNSHVLQAGAAAARAAEAAP